MRSVDGGETFVVTRNGTRLLPLHRYGRLTSPRPRQRSLHLRVRRRRTLFACEPISTLTSTRIRRRVPKHEQGLINTSVVIDLETIDPAHLPPEITIAAITLAGLAAGPHATKSAAERAGRQDRLQRSEAMFNALPFDRDAARAYGRIYAAAVDAGRTSRSRLADYLIAATAVSANFRSTRGIRETSIICKISLKSSRCERVTAHFLERFRLPIAAISRKRAN